MNLHTIMKMRKRLHSAYTSVTDRAFVGWFFSRVPTCLSGWGLDGDANTIMPLPLLLIKPLPLQLEVMLCCALMTPTAAPPLTPSPLSPGQRRFLRKMWAVYQRGSNGKVFGVTLGNRAGNHC